MSGQSKLRRLNLLKGWSAILTVTRARKPLAAFLVFFLLFHWTIPVFAQSAAATSQVSPGGARSGLSAAPPPGRGRGAPVVPPSQAQALPGGQSTMAATGGEGTQGALPTSTFSVDAFQSDLFTGAATAEIPIVVPPGTGGAAPKVVLRYNSGTVDALRTKVEYGLFPDQAPWTGLGWTLDVGGFILRDTKNTTSLTDDTFKLVFGGVAHDLVLVDSSQSPYLYYHSKDETFWRVQYNTQQDSWTLTTKEGTIHRFGSAANSKAVGILGTSVTVTYRYLLDEVTTTSGTGVKYTYAHQTAQVPYGNMPSFDQAVYPETIKYTYYSGSVIGGETQAREVRFLRAPRTDWTDLTLLLIAGSWTVEKERLDAIEVRVAGNLVRKYVFGFDPAYTVIDRDPTYTWSGGALGDLALVSVTQYGSDGTSTLPPLSFEYSDSLLHIVRNGIGGTVTYTYNPVSSRPIRWALTDPGCYYDFGMVNDPTLFPNNPNCIQSYPVLGYAFATNVPGTVPLYGVIRGLDAWYGAYYDWGVSLSSDTGNPTWNQYSFGLGYVFPANSNPADLPQGTPPCMKHATTSSMRVWITRPPQMAPCRALGLTWATCMPEGSTRLAWPPAPSAMAAAPPPRPPSPTPTPA